jgi:uncharacterized protein YndB with AHSA1/START domain
VIDRRNGTCRFDEVKRDGLPQLRTDLDRFWTSALAAYKAAVETTTGGEAMTVRAEPTAVRHEIVVDAPPERAFSVFTDDFGAFKPREHNMLAVDIAETVFEPRVGGHIYDRGVDGSEFRWARILAYEPPNRVVFSWDISPQWQLESDPEKTSEVEVQFIAEAPDRTRVVLEHRNLDRHLEGWEAVREGVDSEGGWPLYLQRYANLFAA